MTMLTGSLREYTDEVTPPSSVAGFSNWISKQTDADGTSTRKIPRASTELLVWIIRINIVKSQISSKLHFLDQRHKNEE